MVNQIEEVFEGKKEEIYKPTLYRLDDQDEIDNLETSLSENASCPKTKQIIWYWSRPVKMCETSTPNNVGWSEKTLVSWFGRLLVPGSFSYCGSRCMSHHWTFCHSIRHSGCNCCCSFRWGTFGSKYLKFKVLEDVKHCIALLWKWLNVCLVENQAKFFSPPKTLSTLLLWNHLI